MPHIHELIDFTVGIFIIKDNRVLLVDHRKLGCWLCPGGHIELNEDPEAAAYREVKEETGLDIKLIGERPDASHESSKSLIPPRFLDIHKISDTHQHIGMYYLAIPIGGDFSPCQREFNAVKWFAVDELDGILRLPPNIKWYARRAIEELNQIQA